VPLKGSGRAVSIAAMPIRAVIMPLTTPSPSLAESRAASPWPTSCCTTLSPAAIEPGHGKMSEHVERSQPQ
jgi:hypothetical protein